MRNVFIVLNGEDDTSDSRKNRHKQHFMIKQKRQNKSQHRIEHCNQSTLP